MEVRFSNEEFAQVKDMLLLYGWAHEILITKLKVLRESLENFTDTTPIEHMKYRLKTPLNIAQKLHRMGHDITAHNARTKLKDIAGIRIICPFSKDIYDLVDLLRQMPDTRVELEKDYVTTPKATGYRSYHVIMEVPVYYLGKIEKVPVEVQLRTSSMDFWATLEHKARYSYKNHIPKELTDGLVACADDIAQLDARMFTLHNVLTLYQGGKLTMK